MGQFGNLFKFKTAYAYNSESFAYVNCLLLKTVCDDLPASTTIPEALLNFKTSKIKFNVGGYIYTIPFDVAWTAVEKKNASENDSDFDCDDDDDDDDSDSSSSSEDDDDSDDGL